MIKHIHGCCLLPYFPPDFSSCPPKVQQHLVRSYRWWPRDQSKLVNQQQSNIALRHLQAKTKQFLTIGFRPKSALQKSQARLTFPRESARSRARNHGHSFAFVPQMISEITVHSSLGICILIVFLVYSVLAPDCISPSAYMKFNVAAHARFWP
jgi:hypothetical protein